MSKNVSEKYKIRNYIFLLYVTFLVIGYIVTSIKTLLHPVNQSYYNYLFGPLHYDYLFSMIIIGTLIFISLLSLVLRERSYQIPIFLTFLLIISFIVIAILSKAIISLLAFTWIFVLSWVSGKKIINLILKEQNLSWLETGMLSIAFGFGIYSFFILVLSLTGLLYSIIVYPVLVLFSLIFFRDIMAFFKEVPSHIKNFPSLIKETANPILVSILVSIVLIMILVNFIGAIAPEIQYDALNYHLTVPRIYIEHHHIINLPNILQSYFAKSIEMLYALSMMIGGQITAKLISYSFGILIILSIICFAKRFFSFRTAIIAASLFYVLPFVSWLTTTTYIELAISFYIICVLFVFLLWRENSKKSLLLLCGLLSGFVLSAKLTSILFLIPITLSIMAISYYNSKKVRRIILDLIVFSFPILVIAVPWYLITYFQTGNPIFPFFNALFKSPLGLLKNTYMDLKTFGMGYGLKAILLFPWYATFESSKYAGGQSNGCIGVIMLLSLPAIFFIRRSKEIFILLFISIVSIVIWFNIGQYLRYIIPTLAILSILAAYLLSYFINNYAEFYKSIYSTILIIILLASIPVYLVTFYNISERIPYKVAFGLESNDDYLAKVIRTYRATQYLNQHYDPNKIKLLLLGWELRYYVDAQTERFDSLELRHFPSNWQLPAYLQKKGFTHILIDAITAKKDWLKLINDEIVKRNYAKLEYRSKYASLYKLTYNH